MYLRLLRFHTHSLIKPASYYLEPLPLPPEDLDAPLEKVVKLADAIQFNFTNF